MFAEALLLVQVVAVPFRSATDQRPVRLWLGASPVTTGSAVPVYVAAASDGYLLVLRVATDGRVAVVFPADPKTNGFVTRGSYELRGNAGQPALIVNEGRGTGLVLAALSETPFRFTEFARAGRWDGALLVASHPEADGPGTLSDIAQRMLGDGWFNSDFAMYTVRSPQTEARIQQQRQALPEVGSSEVLTTPDITTCTGCTIVYQTVSPAPLLEQTPVEQAMVEPVVIYPSACDVWSGNCGYYAPGAFVSSNQFNRRNDYDRRKYAEFAKLDHRRPPRKTEGICTIGVDCPRGVGRPAMVIPAQQRSLTLSPVGRPTPVAPPTPPVYAVQGTQRVVALAKPTPVAAQAAPVVRRGARASAVTMPVGVKSGVMPRRTVGSAMRGAGSTGAATGAMTSRQMGTAMRASKAMARRN